MLVEGKELHFGVNPSVSPSPMDLSSQKAVVMK